VEIFKERLIGVFTFFAILSFICLLIMGIADVFNLLFWILATCWLLAGFTYFIYWLFIEPFMLEKNKKLLDE
jgi:hypothetical protein